MTRRERIATGNFQPSPSRMLKHITKPFEYWEKATGPAQKVPVFRGRWVRTGKDYSTRIAEKIKQITQTLGRSAQR